jgi:hypothetical protein
MIRYLSAILLSVMCCCGDKIQVTQSTLQEWVGGLPESGYGTNYKLIVKVKADSDQLQFDDLWVDTLHMKVRVIADSTNFQNKSFNKGSQIILRAEVMFRPGADGQIRQSDADKSPKPFNFKGEGLLGYTYKGHKEYVEITQFKILEKLIYP